MERTSRLVDTTFDRAVAVLKDNVVKEGLRASAAYYNQVWARDAFISLIGANLLEDGDLLKCARDTVFTFSKTASPLGQIPNFYDPRTRTPDYGYSGSTDSTSWYIIGLASLFAATEDHSLLRGPLRAAINAYRWLRYQDANNTWLIDSPPGADWMDAAVQRTGKTLYNNVLFLIATLSLELLANSARESFEGISILEFSELRQRFSDVFLPDRGSTTRISRYWPQLAKAYAKTQHRAQARGYYLHYISFSRIDAHFDTLSNLLCILSGLADAGTTDGILGTIRSRGLSKPYPVRVLDPPYADEGANFDKGFDSSLPVQHRSEPYAYHNGAVWPFVGGFYVASMFASRAPGAETELENLARANSVLGRGERIGFNEWLHGRTGEPLGQYGQSWNAGAYIAAAQASKGRRVFDFTGAPGNTGGAL